MGRNTLVSLRIRFRYQLRALPLVVPFSIISLMGICGLWDEPLGLAIMLFWFGITFLPVAFLHVEYYLENRRKIFDIDDRSISVFKNGELVLRYENSELDRILFYKARVIESHGPYRFPTQYYCYLRFIPYDNKEEIVVTSLTTPKYFEEIYVRNVKVEVKLSVFPSIRYPFVVKERNLPEF